MQIAVTACRDLIIVPCLQKYAWKMGLFGALEKWQTPHNKSDMKYCTFAYVSSSLRLHEVDYLSRFMRATPSPGQTMRRVR